MSKKPFLICSLALALSLLAPAAQAHMDDSVSSLAAGMPVTPTTLTGLDGKSYTLPASGPEVIVFWSVYDPQPLPAMFDTLQKLSGPYRGRVRMTAVNLDSRALVKNLADRVKARAKAERLGFPMVLDPLRYTRDEFHIKRTPAVVILKDGRVEGYFSFDHPEDATIVELNLRRLAPSDSRR